MVAVTTEGIAEVGREAYLKELFESAKNDNSAFKRLGQIASGRNDLPLARKLFAELDRQPLERNETNG